MKIDVVNVVDPDQGFVFSRGVSGAAVGRWKGASAPVIGQCNVEIEVPHEVEGWVPAAGGTASLAKDETEFGVVITGEVVRSGEEGDPVVEVRVDSDIVLVEIPDRPADGSLVGLITFRAPEIHLYPYEL